MSLSYQVFCHTCRVKVRFIERSNCDEAFDFMVGHAGHAIEFNDFSKMSKCDGSCYIPSDCEGDCYEVET